MTCIKKKQLLSFRIILHEKNTILKPNNGLHKNEQIPFYMKRNYFQNEWLAQNWQLPSAFDDLSVLEDENAVGVSDGRQAMRDDDRRSVDADFR